MDNKYLEDLILETKSRGGGMMLSLEGKPEIVVLLIEEYNKLISSHKNPMQTQIAEDVNSFSGKVLVTGGAGYIGSHVVEELVSSGYEVVIVDNLSAGKRENLHPGAKFYEGDIKDLNFLRDVFATEKISAVMHFAASIEVAESVKEPEKYLENNVTNTARLLVAMKEAGVNKIVFSSTAAVYGEQEKMPIAETAPVRPNNPYGFSKLLAEKTIKYFCQFAGFEGIVFRYFNACGCRPDGSVLPTHHSHLVDNVMEVAAGRKQSVEVFGNDFSTFDGTGVRDYVHVKDIAGAHVEALKHFSGDNYQVFNIGTGKGLSVLEIIHSASEVLNKIIPMEMSSRRPGDAAETVADNSKIFKAWNFKPQYSDLENILKSAWKQKLASLKQ
ncbi:MAG: UDP-glucose 4-epimerase GalE [Candidatus Doudnabacteria bacterium]|nr:UDP-glucose 4-epimerase GalE [Candidatus Doudnabacteria bacterium]